MEADDAADLLGELPPERRGELLEAMDPAESEPLRRLLAFAADTAGGLMTPEPVIAEPRATVAEALARIRNPDLLAPLAAQVFVCLAPTDAPTGRYLGVAHFQRLLREPPSKPLGRCVADVPEPLSPDVPAADVARRLAAYDVVALPVVDAAQRLLGAVTVDDVLDQMLPAGWRLTTGGALMPRRDDLSRPRGTAGAPAYDPDAFGRFAERLARYLGTGRYLAIQTLIVIVWIAFNVAATALRWDPYPFILLNLAFSTQAAYAAPLILLAQNRQTDRDRAEVERDREAAARQLAESEFLARELAGLRLLLEQAADRDDLAGRLDELAELIEARLPTP